MITKHQLAAEKMAKAAALRRVVNGIPNIADRVSRNRVRRENTCFTLYKAAYNLQSADITAERVVAAEHDALAELTETLETVINDLVISAAKDLAAYSKGDVRDSYKSMKDSVAPIKRKTFEIRFWLDGTPKNVPYKSNYNSKQAAMVRYKKLCVDPNVTRIDLLKDGHIFMEYVRSTTKEL